MHRYAQECFVMHPQQNPHYVAASSTRLKDILDILGITAPILWILLGGYHNSKSPYLSMGADQRGNPGYHQQQWQQHHHVVSRQPHGV
jgi:hypothetical protein